MKAHTTTRLLTALACTLSIISILTPFLQTTWTGATVPETFLGPENFWSFLYTTQYSYMGHGPFHKELWFADFWSQAANNILFKEAFAQLIGPVLITMFLTQILTILFGSLSIIKPKPTLLLLSTILSAATIFSMLFITQALWNTYAKNLQAGFGLAVASTALYLTAFVWRITSRQQATPQRSNLA